MPDRSEQIFSTQAITRILMLKVSHLRTRRKRHACGNTTRTFPSRRDGAHGRRVLDVSLFT
jgi:hypothetical protein